MLGVAVLVQNPKGGGLSQTFGGGNQIMGARRTTDFLEKATWTLAIALCVFSIFSAYSIPRDRQTDTGYKSGITVEEDDYAPMPQMPATPASGGQQSETPVE
ncbi:preprotein translocase subunit SecG [Bacteroidia bacterium]|nr:preprotein translocase subunit SecG [Bacteroidia bacterium]